MDEPETPIACRTVTERVGPRVGADDPAAWDALAADLARRMAGHLAAMETSALIAPYVRERWLRGEWGEFS